MGDGGDRRSPASEGNLPRATTSGSRPVRQGCQLGSGGVAGALEGGVLIVRRSRLTIPTGRNKLLLVAKLR